MSAPAQTISSTRLRIQGEMLPDYAQILTPDAVALVSELVERFAPQRNELLKQRVARQARIDGGELPDFLPETAHIRDGDWTVRGIPADLQDRRVEITGPVDRKMVINALNANVKVHGRLRGLLAPAWNKVIEGQINLRDAVNGTIAYQSPEGKAYTLNPNPAVLICRARSHLPEKHVTFDGAPIPGGLFDFALYFLHNHKALSGQGIRSLLLRTQAAEPSGRALVERGVRLTEDKFGPPAVPSRPPCSSRPCRRYSRWTSCSIR
jgi:malate synthase